MHVNRDFPEHIAHLLETLPMTTIEDRMMSPTLGEEHLTPEEDAAFDQEIAEAVEYSLTHDDPADNQPIGEFLQEMREEGLIK